MTDLVDFLILNEDIGSFEIQDLVHVPFGFENGEQVEVKSLNMFCQRKWGNHTLVQETQKDSIEIRYSVQLNRKAGEQKEEAGKKTFCTQFSEMQCMCPSICKGTGSAANFTRTVSEKCPVLNPVPGSLPESRLSPTMSSPALRKPGFGWLPWLVAII